MNGDPLADLAAALHHLRRGAGEPSMREIARNIRYSHTAVTDAFKGLRCPTWPMLKAIVQHLGGDPTLFHQRWIAVRNRQNPVPEVLVGLDERTADEAEEGHAASAGGQVCLTYSDGTHTFVFSSERLAWRFLKMRGGPFDD